MLGSRIQERLRSHGLTSSVRIPYRISKEFYILYGRNVMRAQMLEISLFEVGTVLHPEKDARLMVK